MELIYKAAVLTLFSAIVSMLLKRHNPEVALLLCAVTALGVLAASMGFLTGLQELREEVKRITGSSETLITPVMKCLAVAMITKITAELCRDSSQSAAAASVELAGSICAVSTVMPLLLSVLKMIGGLI